MALISLEDWDAIWRRNQHLTAHLVGSGLVDSIDFLEPPLLRRRRLRPRTPLPGVRAVPLTLRLPKRAGGLVELGTRLRLGALRRADVLWVNDPALGVHCLRRGQPVVYDVTDDWRSYDFPPRIVQRIIKAEDLLARRARTVVCSEELRDRWQERYSVEAAVVHNGVDGAAWRAAVPHRYDGPGPHVGYVGTLQPERLDVDLVLHVADDEAIGTLHLIGPDALDDASRGRLRAHPRVVLHGPVPSADVPSRTKGLDVVLSPHVVTSFTLSLDAIKSYEYLASGRPVVATPTSGFHLMGGRPGIYVTSPACFTSAVRTALAGPRPAPVADELDWSARARQFAAELLASLPERRPR
ncbi:glycosyltransferase [Geodermatophilus sp. SYSU D01036]